MLNSRPRMCNNPNMSEEAAEYYAEGNERKHGHLRHLISSTLKKHVEKFDVVEFQKPSISRNQQNKLAKEI